VPPKVFPQKGCRESKKVEKHCSKDMSQDKNNPPISSNQRLVTKLIMNYLKIQQVDYDKFQNRATLGIN